ncbi:MAG: hypothetical protein K9K80_01340 [Spirochaetia bacterium]|nr:hypothetical protein [Spirochaetia bacterium]
MNIDEEAKELLLEEVMELKVKASFDEELECKKWIWRNGIEEYNTYETYYDWDNDYHVIKVKYNPIKNPYAGDPFH